MGARRLGTAGGIAVMAQPPATPRRRIEGPVELRAALLAGLLQATADAEPEITLVDADFAAWPLDEPALIDALTAWAKGPQRRLRLLAHHFDELPRRHPRFTAWRRPFAHVIDCREAPEVDVSEFPLLLLTARCGLQCGAGPRFAGRWLDEDAERRTWRGVVDAITQRSVAAFPAHTLGL